MTFDRVLTISSHVRSDVRYRARTHDLSGGRTSLRRLSHRSTRAFNFLSLFYLQDAPVLLKRLQCLRRTAHYSISKHFLLIIQFDTVRGTSLLPMLMPLLLSGNEQVRNKVSFIEMPFPAILSIACTPLVWFIAPFCGSELMYNIHKFIRIC